MCLAYSESSLTTEEASLIASQISKSSSRGLLFINDYVCMVAYLAMNKTSQFMYCIKYACCNYVCTQQGILSFSHVHACICTNLNFLIKSKEHVCSHLMCVLLHTIWIENLITIYACNLFWHTLAPFSYTVILHLMLIVGCKLSDDLYPMHLYWNENFRKRLFLNLACIGLWLACI